MSGLRQERGSKWELEPDISPDKCRDSGWSSRAGSSFHEHKSQKYLSGRRGYHKTEYANEESRAAWEGADRYDTARVSPALDVWRRRNHSRSPRSSRGSRSHRSKSRSRSRSPPRNLRKEPGFDDGNSCAGSAEVCKDFAAGSCRKGELCHFSHHGSPVHDRSKFDRGNGEGWESRHGGGPLRHSSPEYHLNGRRSAAVCNSFLAGRCRKGSSCKYVHHDSKSNEYGKELLDDVYKDEHADWRGRDGRSCDRREPHRVSEKMCRFFLAGNCRDGKHCRFSHHQEDAFNHERRLLGQRRLDHNRNNMDDLWERSKWSSYRSPPRNGTEARIREDDRNTKMIDSTRPTDGKWSNFFDMDQESVGRDHSSHVGPPCNSGGDKAMLSSKEQSLHWKEDCGAGSLSESKGENCFTERAVPSPNSVFKQQTVIFAEKCDSALLSRISFPSSDQDVAQGTLSETHHGGKFMQPNSSDDCGRNSFGNAISTGTGMNSTSYSKFNASSSFLPSQNTLPMNENAQLTLSSRFSANDQTYHSQPKVGDAMQVSHDRLPVDAKTSDTSHAGPENLLNATGIAIPEHTREQLAHYSQLKTTLAHLIERLPITQQSAITGGLSNHSLDSLVVPASMLVSSAASQPNQVSGPLRQYGAVSNSVESKLPQSGEQISTGMGTSLVPCSTTVPASFTPSVQTIALDNILGQKDLTEEGNVTVAEVDDNLREEKNEEPENGVQDDVNVEGGGGDDEKKGKDSKVVRAFKFALAEFVKELLKPTWKDGQVSKEVYKTIVKKVVDKVSDSIQPAHVPRTKEKINQYLSSSKPKLSKLVQAYLEKYQKA